MTWLIWRQHRGQALWTAATITTICALMLWSGCTPPIPCVLSTSRAAAAQTLP